MTFHDRAGWDNGGIVKNKDVYFAILAHKNEEALAEQIRNIRHFNPDAGIIVYNGGPNPGFGKDMNTLFYPGSHPIRYGNLAPYFWEIMKWLEECRVEYKYLINLDHDVLFVKHGFTRFLNKLMEGYDVMGWDMVPSSSPSDAVLSCCRGMWKEWDKWQPLLGTDKIYRYLNPTQVYTHEMVRRMLETTDHKLAEELIADSKVFALEEVFFVTLAYSRGARIREYPREENWKRASRFSSQINFEEAEWSRNHPLYYWIHPVKDERLIRMNKWLMGESPLEIEALDQPAQSEATELETQFEPLPNANPAPKSVTRRRLRHPAPRKKLKKLKQPKKLKKLPMKPRADSNATKKKRKKPIKAKPSPLKMKLLKKKAAGSSTSRLRKRPVKRVKRKSS